ncbi:hypothetical protein GCM10023322_25680 [Rugosimonospora acidiphila]|uniref:Uncharacterized protein n=1 Tax=Rugosimonospora acidiphila TaxID=556531 RepID=A0ABP9RS60_9ACTN
MSGTVGTQTSASEAALRAAAERQIAVTRKTGRPASSTLDQRVARRRQEMLLKERREAEYHQARVLLLIDALAGKSSALDGLTKLAKLDFLLRYPVFLEELANSGVDALQLSDDTKPTPEERSTVESRMMRYKYGPWDDRYYGIIGALVGRGLVEYVSGKRGNIALRPTDGGRALARLLATDPAWRLTAARCAVLHRAFARKSGNAIKSLIYDRLPDVVDRPHRTEI